MKTKKVLFYILAGILAGCVPVISLHPLYEEKDLLFEQELLGTWVDADDPNRPASTWEFRRSAESEKAYELTITDNENKKGSFAAHLVKLDGSLFMDVFPNRLSSGKEKLDEESLVYNAFFFVPVHTFLKIDFITPLAKIKSRIPDANMNDMERLSKDYDYALRLRITKDDECEKLLNEDPYAVNPYAVKYEKVENRGIVLTASTKDLQKFVVKYAGDERLFGKPDDLIRAKSKEPPRATGQDSNSPPKN